MMQSITFVALTLLAASGVNAGTQKTIAPTPAMVTPEPATPAPIEEIVTPEPTAAPTPCGNRLFYVVTIDGITKCSNGYDAQTDIPDFFDTSTECCAYLTNENMLDADDYLVACVTNEPDTMMLVVSEKGLGKRTPFAEYRMTNRGTKGVITMNVTEKTGKLVAALAVHESDELMLMTSKGQSVRIRAGGEKGIRETGRNAQGVKLMDLRETEIIQDVALVASEEEIVETVETGEVVTAEVQPSSTESAETAE